MGIFDKLFGQKKNGIDSNNSEHAVIIDFLYGLKDLEPLHKLENQLRTLINENSLGEYDGHDIATDYSDGILYMYGPNAELIFKSVQPVLEKAEFMKGANVKMRFGPPEDGVKEIEVKLNK